MDTSQHSTEDGITEQVFDQVELEPFGRISKTQISRKDIHYALYKTFYMKKRMMPTSQSLFNEVHGCLPPHIDIRYFRDALVEMGYIFKKSGPKTVVVMENPAVRFERFLYLKNIQEYRKEGKTIYFVCQAALQNGKILIADECDRQQKDNLSMLLYVASDNDVTCSEVPPESLTETYIKTLLTELVSKDAGSVIVIDNSKRLSEKFCETPNENSLKCDMIEWLEYHQIPFSESMSRFELWMLIEKFTKLHANMSKVQNLIKTLGFNVLRIPDCINYLTPASYINDLLAIEIKTHNLSLKQAMLDIGRERLKEFNSDLVAEEEKLLKLEIKIDGRLEDLILSTDVEPDNYLPCLRTN